MFSTFDKVRHLLSTHLCCAELICGDRQAVHGVLPSSGRGAVRHSRRPGSAASTSETATEMHRRSGNQWLKR